MREWVLLAVFVSVLPFAVRNTWVGVLLWNWISLMNPHRLSWGFAYFAPFAAVAAGATLISLVLTRDKLKVSRDPPVIVLSLLVLWMCLTTAVAIDPASSWEQLSKVLKIQLMVLVAFAALHSRKHIELFIRVTCCRSGSTVSRAASSRSRPVGRVGSGGHRVVLSRATTNSPWRW